MIYFLYFVNLNTILAHNLKPERNQQLLPFDQWKNKEINSTLIDQIYSRKRSLSSFLEELLHDVRRFDQCIYKGFAVRQNHCSLKQYNSIIYKQPCNYISIASAMATQKLQIKITIGSKFGLNITFLEIHIPNTGKNCDFNSIHIFEAQRSDSNQWTKMSQYCGHLPEFSIMSPQNKVLIFLDSGHIKESVQVLLSYQVTQFNLYHVINTVNNIHDPVNLNVQ